MGLEALSRGAASAVFVESDRAAADTIVRNLEKLRPDRSDGAPRRRRRVLAAEAAARRRYDLVLIDPPYAMLAGLLPTLDRYVPPLLERDGLVVVESSAKDEPELPSLSVRTSRALRRRPRDALRGGGVSDKPLVAICPGAYDPVTYGHVDIVARASRIFDRVVVAVVREPQHKSPAFTAEERVAFLEEALPDLENVEVAVFSELVVEFARQIGATTLIKGLRAISDFEWEFQMNHLNRSLAPDIETLYLMASPQHSFLSSSGVKEIASFGGSVEGLVPPAVAARFAELHPISEGSE